MVMGFVPAIPAYIGSLSVQYWGEKSVWLCDFHFMIVIVINLIPVILKKIKYKL